MENERQSGLYVAWHIEALRRTEKMPELRTLLGLKREAQDPDELIEALERWAMEHNAAYNAAQRQGLEED